MAVQTKPFITPEEYLERERQAEYKSEYYNGEIFAMSGGTHNHSLLTSNFIAVLNVALRGTGCLVFTSDLRVHIPAVGLYTYPDVSVVCGEVDLLDDMHDILLNPVLLVEVLSPSTESYDRGKKFAFYRSITSLKEYALVSQRQKLVEVFRKNEENLWVLHETDEARGTVELASVGCALQLDDLYANVTFEDVSLR